MGPRFLQTAFSRCARVSSSLTLRRRLSRTIWPCCPIPGILAHGGNVLSTLFGTLRDSS